MPGRAVTGVGQVTGRPRPRQAGRVRGSRCCFASGAVLGGLLVEVTWRLVFFVNVPIGIALLAASMRLLPADPPGRGGQLDLPGAVTVTAGIALLVLAVVRAGDTLQVTQPALLGGLAALLLAAFVVREKRTPAPLLDLALLKRPRHCRSQSHLDRGRRLQRRPGPAGGAVPAGRAGTEPGAHRPVLRPAGGRGVRAVGPGLRLVPALGPRRALAIALSTALLALAGAAAAVLAGSLPALLAAQFALGVAARLSQVASTLAGTRGPAAARSEGTASALLTATRQCGSALGVAIVSATLVAAHGSVGQRTAASMLVAAGFALAGLLATRVVPPGPPHPHAPQPHHLFRHHAGGIP